MATLQIKDKSQNSLKFLLALRVYNTKFTLESGILNRLLLYVPGTKDAVEFFSPDAAARYLAANDCKASSIKSDEWIEWSLMRGKYTDANLRHLEDNITEIPKSAPCTLMIFASLVFSSLDNYPKLLKWFTDLKTEDAFNMAIKEWEEIKCTNEKSDGPTINSEVIIALDHHKRKMYI